jgi:hypothetical protein
LGWELPDRSAPDDSWDPYDFLRMAAVPVLTKVEIRDASSRRPLPKSLPEVARQAPALSIDARASISHG